MMTFASRRIYNFIILGILSIACYLGYELCNASLQPTNLYTGWALLIIMLLLALYNVRKKLTFLPMLGKSAWWLQFHIYAGFLTVLLFLIHINFRMPHGILELILTFLYILMIISGLLGIFISRTFPVRLTLRGEPILFERISVFRKQLGSRAETIAVDSVKNTNSATIANFHNQTLLPFFARPRNFFLHLVDSKNAYRKLMNDIDVQERYLNSQEREILTELKDLVNLKENLDYQYALQFTLKGWLFVHIPLTYSLLLFSFVHVLLVYAYFGGT